jgi:hypothetical protein
VTPRPTRITAAPVAPVRFSPATLTRPRAFGTPGRLRVPIRFVPSDPGGAPPVAGDFGTIIVIIDTPRIELVMEAGQ